MRKTFVGGVVAVALALSVASVGTARAEPGPSNQCYGEIASGIASTWPWAHDGQTAFPPPPGAIALWLEIFGPEVGVSSVRDLQLLFCGE
jgi:hypothetical protein